jgi:hypothetical protein
MRFAVVFSSIAVSDASVCKTLNVPPLEVVFEDLDREAGAGPVRELIVVQF